MEMPERYREDAVQLILKRAMELDQERGETISEVDIRDIGAELGISRVSVDRALLEMKQSSAAEVSPRFTMGGRFGSIPVPLLAFAGGGVLAASFRVLQTMGAGSVAAFGAMIAALGGAVALATLYRGVAKHERYQFANIALWVGFMLPLALMDGAGVGAMLEGLAPYALMSGIAGSTAIALREFVERFGGASPSAESGHAESFGKRTLRAIRAAVKSWKGTAMLRNRATHAAI